MTGSVMAKQREVPRFVRNSGLTRDADARRIVSLGRFKVVMAVQNTWRVERYKAPFARTAASDLLDFGAI
jgi:hypothetical protein